jgi:hypothetical protein
MTPDDFARKTAEFLRAQGEQRVIAIDGPRNRLVVGAPPQQVSFLGLANAQQEYQLAPQGTGERVLSRRFWSAVQRAPSSVAETVSRAVLPRVRDQAWFSAVRRQAELELGADERAIDKAMVPHAPLNDELSVHLAFELASSVSEIGADRFEAWGLSFDELLGSARRNLAARSPVPLEEASPGVFLSPYHDTFDATRMMLPSLFEGLGVKGAPIAIAPTHDILFVTGEDDPEGLVQAASWAEEALLEPRGHSGLAFKFVGGSWHAWEPPRDHPAWLKFRLLRLQTLATAYARQKEVLEALLRANGYDIAVGTLRAFRTTQGEVFTVCSWTEDQEALLPETDRIDFVTEKGLTHSVSFEVARRTLGELMQPIGDLPERWRVKGFPTSAQLAQMEREAPLD